MSCLPTGGSAELGCFREDFGSIVPSVSTDQEATKIDGCFSRIPQIARLTVSRPLLVQEVLPMSRNIGTGVRLKSTKVRFLPIFDTKQLSTVRLALKENRCFESASFPSCKRFPETFRHWGPWIRFELFKAAARLATERVEITQRASLQDSCPLVWLELVEC